jgi:NADPH-dependent glutamate synthase beta subunit-like oxidoreductase/Pyruvate/2-oxoacid:ferredoxin oxidoreductase delta subunit
MVTIAGRELEFQPVQESPCRRACPAGIDVKRYVGQIADGNFSGALATIRKHMPFPSACGRVCLHPCENECVRGDIDEPIAIMHLKRFVTEYESRKGEDAPLPDLPPPTGNRIAIIGSGPAGLTAAHDLALMGHSVTVLEKEAEPGGMLIQALPEFVLPSSAVNRDIERITDLGVIIKCGRAIHGETGLTSLLTEGFDAVLLATGASARWKGLTGSRWIPGGRLAGVTGAVEFMKQNREYGSGKSGYELGRVVVLGSGVQALACARTAIRLGCEKVHWLVPCRKEHLQPDHRTVKQAEEEGVVIHELTRPISIESKDEYVSGVKIIDLVPGEPDHTGREAYVPDPESEKIIACDTVIDAVYFVPDTPWGKLSHHTWGTVDVDLDTMGTGLPGIFAAGDVISGPKSVVEAVALGHRAAIGINRYINGETGTIGTLSTPVKVSGWEVGNPSVTPSEIFRPEVRPVNERKIDFLEAELLFTMWEATHEARRCLLCGPCEECAVCVSSCYRKRGTAKDEHGNEVVIRIPVDIARSIREKTTVGFPDDVNFFAAQVTPERCRGCGVCEDVCDYKAPRISPDPDYGLVSRIDITACKGCGTCIAACPARAINQGKTSLEFIHNAIWEGVQ